MQCNKAEVFDEGLLFFGKPSQNGTNCFAWSSTVIKQSHNFFFLSLLKTKDKERDRLSLWNDFIQMTIAYYKLVLKAL